jgi:hypothetical protein
LYACMALGAFSVGWNLLSSGNLARTKFSWKTLTRQQSLWGGISAAAAMVLVGNLGIGRMLYRGFMCLGAPVTDMHNCSLNPSIHAPETGMFQSLFWALKGLGKALGGSHLGFGSGEWYYSPSRVISTTEINGITEFPLFTFIHSDLHAHMMALPLAVLAIAWALSVVLASKNSRFSIISLVFGALVIGSLNPTNTWDFYTYLALGGVAVV